MDDNIQTATGYLINNKIKKAKGVFQKLAGSKDFVKAAYAGLSSCYLLEKDLVEAEKHLQISQEKDGEAELLFIASALSYVSEKNYELAEFELMKALKTNAESVYANYIMGALYMRMQNPGMGIQYYVRAIALNNKHWLIYANLAIAYNTIGDYSNALKNSYSSFMLQPSPSNAAYLVFSLIRSYTKIYWALFGICFFVWIVFPSFSLAVAPLVIFIVVAGILPYFISRETKDLYAIALFIILFVVFYFSYIK
ncbi:MAG: hypothetical protein HY864_15355 [Chloroflexi bacterium]|nr:hypothetical protein [Chloroflexota bacterium]